MGVEIPAGVTTSVLIRGFYMIKKSISQGVRGLIHEYIVAKGEHPTDFKEFLIFVAEHRGTKIASGKHALHQKNRIDLWAVNMNQVYEAFDECLAFWAKMHPTTPAGSQGRP